MARHGILASSFALVVLAAGAAAPASAEQKADQVQAKQKVESLARGLVSPLSLAVSGNGTVYVAQNFAGLLTRIAPGGRPTVIHAARKGTEVGAVSERRGTLRFATTNRAKTHLWGMSRGRPPVRLANLGAFERQQNPDAGVSYGFQGLTPACAAQIPEEVPAAYTGIVESHPYATTMVKGTTYVADAAGNDILSVSPRGKVRAVAVLPPVPVVVTPEIAASNKLPACTVGLTYLFEPVPTDVERGPGGRLYVSTLTGGPEDGSTGAQSKVYAVNRRTGSVTLVAQGLVSAVGLAVARNGDIFVSQLFAGQIARIKAGSGVARPWLSRPLPGDIERTDRGVYATINALPPEKGKPNGKVIRVR
ncbi:ScyD/ScyE family protein [Nocardioides sp. LHG3406-4]|uniref:ScyD/ScyE family protein n=1 Tax=Nocardioides sp. LHG3406-4 TaxID=2804575 RepID=UPI003CE82D7C